MLLGGRPLIVRAVETALAAPSIQRVMISTDDPRVADAAAGAGAEVPFMRPAELASDVTPEWLSWQHAIRTLTDQGIDIDLLVTLPATAPLRAVADVEACIAAARQENTDVALTVTPSRHNPYFSVVSVGADGYARIAAGEGGVHRRQDAPEVFDITPVAYAARPAYVLAAGSLLEGRVRAVVVPPSAASTSTTSSTW